MRVMSTPPIYHFYSRPCGRGDLQGVDGYVDQLDFYSRPCGRGDVEKHSGTLFSGGFLLTPLREGRHTLTLYFVSSTLNISTHAPAGGATGSAGTRVEIEAYISTHAPAGGATWVTLGKVQPAAISTHAPAGGATWSS